jgi:hypothetical protein
VVTGQALDEFAKIFIDPASVDAIRALEALFKLDNAQDLEVEAAQPWRGSCPGAVRA